MAMNRLTVRSPKTEDTTRTPSTQLEIAAHWLEEAAASIRHDAALRLNLGRVAHECKAVAFREGK